MTKRNHQSKAGMQNKKSLTEFSSELGANKKETKTEKSRP